ncbi:hypothetical protein [Variovorax sp. HJSM1_2]|uniref:hypothetical protein n=1 Tax=Variovorax sp. HJSM1_2 TaxID=3366263 RepID=UPI003BC19A3D
MLLPRTRQALQASLAVWLVLTAGGAFAQTKPRPSCTEAASDACYTAFRPRIDGGWLHYYSSLRPGVDTARPTTALIAIHGHPRDANRTFNAATRALQAAGTQEPSLIVAPVFQVAEPGAARCQTKGVPGPQADDLLWTCASWMAGGGAFSSFAALDALVTELRQRWPSLQTVTIAGFSAGAQLVQRYIGFAAPPQPGAPRVRYVVASPGSWLYFDAARPVATTQAACPRQNRWKYSTEKLPDTLGRNAEEARQAYAAADVHYLVGALDTGDAPGTHYPSLDRSCAANAQGPYRLERALAYAAADNQQRLAANQPTREVTVVPSCAHDVACVFTSPAARSALLP